MTKALRLSVMGLVGMTAAGVIGFTAPAVATDGSTHGVAYKRDDESGKVITTADDSDDDDQGFKHTSTGTGTSAGTNTNTNTSAGTSTGTHTGAGGGGDDTGTRTRGAQTDHSRSAKVKDFTRDGSGKRHVDHSRGHTNDGSRHNTRG